LHISIQLKKLELVTVLLEFGADFNMMCGDKSCFDLAKDSPPILAALEQAKSEFPSMQSSECFDSLSFFYSSADAELAAQEPQEDEYGDGEGDYYDYEDDKE
jgi:hypothetical protein